MTHHSLNSFIATSRGQHSFSDLKHPALVVVDVQKLFCEPGAPLFLSSWTDAQVHLFSLIKHFTQSGFKIALTQHMHAQEDDGALLGRFFGQLLLRGDPQAELLPALLDQVADAPVFVKSRHSIFTNSALLDYLAGSDGLVLAGVQTPLCILASAVDAARFNLVPVVVKDACAAQNETQHLAALLSLGQGHAHIATSQQVIQELV